MAGVTVRDASEAERALFEQWATTESWNPGCGDIVAFAHLRSPRFLVAVVPLATAGSVGDAGEPADVPGYPTTVAGSSDRVVGMVAIVAHTPTYAFIGYFIVHPSWRNRGVGRHVFDAAVHAVGKPVTLGLDGVLAQVPRYARWHGFQTSHQNTRFSGELAQAAATDSTWGGPNVPVAATGGTVVDAAAMDEAAWNQLAALDLGTFAGHDSVHHRRPFLEHWARGVERPPGCAAACIVANDGRVTAFGCIRQAVDGHRLGPVVASTPSDAERLVRVLVERAGARRIHIDVPDSFGAAVQLADRLGLRPGFACVRMYVNIACPGGDGPTTIDCRYGVPPTPAEAGVYGVFSFETGP